MTEVALLTLAGIATALATGLGALPVSRLGSHAGMSITAVIVLVVANLVDLSAIASVGSAISLTIFLLVGIAGYRRRADTRSSAAIVLAAIALTATVLVFFAVDTLRNEPETFTAIVAILLMSVVLDLVWKRVRGEAVPQEGG